MKTFTVEISEAEYKAFAHTALDPQDWINNIVHEYCRASMEKIFQDEVARMLQDPNIKEIPADREAVVLAANIESAAEIMARLNAETSPVINK